MQTFTKSNTLPNKYLLKIILDFKKDGAFNQYKNALESSFGNDKPSATRLDAFTNFGANEHKVPYFIINSTLLLGDKDLKFDASNKKDRKTEKRLSSVFEITPEFMGNPKIGFSNLKREDVNNPTFSESIAMSGAPKWKLARSIDNPKRDVFKNEKLRLADGGHSENLAALALIRRGVKKIIIVDSEQDPTYTFTAYKDLKKMLNLLQIKLKMPDIKKFLKRPKDNCFDYKPNNSKQKKICSPNSVSIGTATRIGANPIKSDIYYIKMSRAESIYSGRFSDAKAYKAGEELSETRKGQRCVNKRNEKTCSCDSIKQDFIKENKNYESLYTYEVKNYSDHLNYPSLKNPLLWTKIKFLNLVGIIDPFYAYKFPHTTTVDQSFYSDQLEALVGLGYLQTLEPDKMKQILEMDGVE